MAGSDFHPDEINSANGTNGLNALVQQESNGPNLQRSESSVSRKRGRDEDDNDSERKRQIDNVTGRYKRRSVNVPDAYR